MKKWGLAMELNFHRHSLDEQPRDISCVSALHVNVAVFMISDTQSVDSGE